MNVGERFLSKVAPDGNGCLVWTGALSTEGYGRFTADGKLHQAHRWLLERVLGPIDPKLDVDHLCRNRACVRPTHLEVVTRSENLRRGAIGEINRARAAEITHCPQGHPYDDENTYRYRGGRMCKQCHRERHAAVPKETKAAYSRAYRDRQRAAA